MVFQENSQVLPAEIRSSRRIPRSSQQRFGLPGGFPGPSSCYSGSRRLSRSYQQLFRLQGVFPGPSSRESDFQEAFQFLQADRRSSRMIPRTFKQRLELLVYPSLSGGHLDPREVVQVLLDTGTATNLHRSFECRVRVLRGWPGPRPWSGHPSCHGSRLKPQGEMQHPHLFTLTKGAGQPDILAHPAAHPTHPTQ